MEDLNKYREESELVRPKLSRRRVLKLMGMTAAGAALLAACGDNTATTAPATTAASSTTAASAATTAASAATTAASGGAATTAAASGGTATGGSLSISDIKANGKVVFMAGKDATGTVNKLIEAFNAKNTGVTIDFQEQPADSTANHDKYATAFAAKDSSIDLIAADMPWFPEFAAAGYLLPVEKYFNPSARSALFESTLQGASYKDKLFGLPWYLNGGALYYRKDILEKAGVQPPNTYEELAAAATKLQTPEMYGFVVNGFKNEGLTSIWLEFLWGFGGEFWDSKTNQVLVDSPEAQASLQYMVDAIYTKKFLPDKMITWKTPDAYNAFLQGNAVFLRGWTDFAPQAEGASSKIKGMWGIKTITAASGKKPAACLGNWNLAINANSKNPDAAWKVVDYFLSVEAQKTLTLGTGRPPARKDVYSDKDVLTNSPSFNVMNDVFGTAKPRPVSPAYPQVSSEVIQDQVSKVLANQVSPKEATKNMSDAAKKIFEKFKG